MRRLTLRYPPAIQATNKVKTTYYIKSKKGKDLKRVSFVCQSCGRGPLKRSEVELDHIIPVVGQEGFTNLQDFTDRLFCEESGFQILCCEPDGGCHRRKTKLEMGDKYVERKKRKKK